MGSAQYQANHQRVGVPVMKSAAELVTPLHFISREGTERADRTAAMPPLLDSSLSLSFAPIGKVYGGGGGVCEHCHCRWTARLFLPANQTNCQGEATTMAVNAETICKLRNTVVPSLRSFNIFDISRLSVCVHYRAL
jgi:hypothetical protein